MIKRTQIDPQLKKVLVIYGLLATIFFGMLLFSDDYRSVQNIGNVLVQSVPLAIVSMGQMVVLIGGGIDMSVGAMISLTSCIAARTMSSAGPTAALGGLLIVLAAVLVGILNGIGTNYGKVPAMITTLSMMMVLNGISLALLPGPGGRVDKAIAGVIMARSGLFSVALLILLLAYLLMRHFLYHTRHGLHVYAIGKNRTVAASMGVRVNYVSILTFVVSALTAAVSGLLLASRMRIGDPTIGASFGLDSITAAAIGGTALTGGVGLLSGTIAGAFLIGMLSNMMNILGVNHFYQYVFKGLLLVVAMVFYSLSGTMGGKRHE